MSPDCDLFAASDEAKMIYIWKKGRESPLINLVGNSSLVTSLLLNSKQAELYSGLKGGLVVIWDLESSKVKYNLQGHSTAISAMSLAKVNESPFLLSTASIDGKIKVWDIRNKNNSINLKGHLEGIKTLSISPDCSLIASGAEDGLLRLWDLRTNKMLKEFSIDDQNVVNCVEFNPHSITLAYGANDKTIKHWDIERYSLISVTPMDRLPIIKIKFDSTGKNVFAGTNESFKYWMIDDDEPILLDMAEAGWNKLQDVQYIENEALYALSIYNNKISYWIHPYEDIAKASENNKVKRSHSDISSNVDYFNNNIIRKQINNIQKNVAVNTNIDKNLNSSNSISDFFTTESLFNKNQNDNVFIRNGNKINK